MRRILVKLGALLVVAVCLWGHVSELFDHWDNTLVTGQDIEYTLVLVAVATGAVLTLIELAERLFRNEGMGPISMLPSISVTERLPPGLKLLTHSPPLSLRI